MDMKDIGVYGESSHWIAVSSAVNEQRTLLGNALICSWLENHDIMHVGVMNAEYPYEVQRANQSGTYMMVVLEGSGEVLIEGEWKVADVGDALLLPPYMFNAFRCIEGVPWKFVWVRYGEEEDVSPVANTGVPVRERLDGRSLENAVLGLWHEMQHGGKGELAVLWSDLIHQHVVSFAKVRDLDPRLWRIWNKVSKDLGRRWTLGELAEIGIVSEEHLRRLCKKQLGRSPMQYLIYLRMMEARNLLINTSDKIEVIANTVGYENAFTFSNTFKAWFGVRPSSLRS